ncbi:hypothetical protein GCM10008106_18260 [Mongoliitalea lutea]|uniref:PKD domain-containing protein n=3 Tax=Mongoliitalea lutea TaxID=849756 RepID=A0A8J3CXW1_9BACT|nr:hypothetical protein GCM10008106_18260 [Mongoliitalea lutea]
MYEVDPVTGELNVFNLDAGVYTYYLELSGPQFCTIVQVGTIEVSLPLEATTVVTPVICFGDNNGSIEVLYISGGNPPLEYSLDGVNWVSSNLFENLSPGTYEVSVRDASGTFSCELILPSVEILGPPSAIGINNDVIIERSSCGLANGSITNIQVQGGWGSYSFEWRRDSPTGPLVSNGTLTGIEGLLPGFYYLIILDAEGCEEIFEFEIIEQPNPNYELVPLQDSCEGESITLSALNTVSGAAQTDFVWSRMPNLQGVIEDGVDPTNPAVSYNLSEDLNSLSLEISGLSPGTYTYYLTILCTGQELRFDFEVYPTPNPILQSQDISCFGANDGQILLMSGGDNSFIYTINGAQVLTETQLALERFSPGTYIVEVSNAFGCVSEPIVLEIMEPEALVFQTFDTKDSACGSNDGEIEVSWSGGTELFTVILFEGSTEIRRITTSDRTYMFDQLAPGVYEVQIIDANGCTVNSPSPIEILNGPTEITVANVEICEGQVATITPSINPVNSNAIYAWYWGSVSSTNLLTSGEIRNGVSITIASNGQISLEGIQGGESVDLWVTVSGSGVCEGDVQQAQINVLPAPVITVSKQDELCFGDGGSISVSSALIEPFEIRLNGSLVTVTNGVIAGLAPGTYSIEALSASGCSYQLQEDVVILGPSAPVSLDNLTIAEASCGLSTGSINGRVSGGTAPYTINLISSSGQIVSTSSQGQGVDFALNLIAGGTYSIQAIDANSCEIVISDIFMGETIAEIEVEDIVICVGETATLSPQLIPANPAVRYTWYYDRNLTDPVLLNSAPDRYGATYTSDGLTLTVQNLPASNTTYSYFVSIEGTSCVPETVEARITVRPIPTLRVSNPSIVCDPEGTVDLTQFIEGFNPNVFDYIITSPNGNILRIDDLYEVSSSGSYNVQSSFRGTNCWTAVNRISVIITDELLTANFDYLVDINGTEIPNAEVQILEDIQFNDLSNGNAVIWNWDFGDGNTSSDQNPIHQFAETGTYTVRLLVIDAFGCTSEFTRVVSVFNDYLIIFPNAFTPLGSINKFFKPKFRGISTMELYIFNTWGDLIFRTNELNTEGWDGTLNGSPVPNGNYVYKAIFTTREGEKVERSGVFLLIK